MTSPAADTNTDSVLDMAKEQRLARGSRRNICLVAAALRDRFPVLLLLLLSRMGAAGGMPSDLGIVGGLARMGNGFSWPSLPRVGGADSARLLCTVIVLLRISFVRE
jgi:hypothetical protein